MQCVDLGQPDQNYSHRLASAGVRPIASRVNNAVCEPSAQPTLVRTQHPATTAEGANLITHAISVRPLFPGRWRGRCRVGLTRAVGTLEELTCCLPLSALEEALTQSGRLTPSHTA
jgi:hypothetical protein